MMSPNRSSVNVKAKTDLNDKFIDSKKNIIKHI